MLLHCQVFVRFLVTETSQKTHSFKTRYAFSWTCRSLYSPNSSLGDLAHKLFKVFRVVGFWIHLKQLGHDSVLCVVQKCFKKILLNLCNCYYCKCDTRKYLFKIASFIITRNNLCCKH